VDARIVNFEAPKIPLGSPVLWYRTGTVDSKHAQLGFVIHAGHRTLTVRLSSGQRVDAVRHCTDPKLELSAEQREQGCWDYTPHYLEMERRWNDVEERLDALERQITAAITTPKKPKELNASLKEMADLRREAKELGIRPPTNIKLENLRQLVLDARDEKVGV
jgi:hypothetical protein